MKRRALFAVSVLTATLLGACATPASGPSASAQLAARSGSTVSGNLTFTERGGSLRIDGQLAGLTPGEHGFHIHEVGDCSAPDATTAKGHYNPAGQQHGRRDSEMHHGGDMPNLTANAQGEAHLAAEIKGLTLNEILGRSVVVHADPDDYKSQPAGNSGKRVACGVIVAG